MYLDTKFTTENENKSLRTTPTPNYRPLLEDLIIKTQAGDLPSLRRLCRCFSSLLKSTASAPEFRRFLDRDEALSIAALAFLELVHNYRSDSYVHFPGLVKLHIRSRLIDEIRRTCRISAREISLNYQAPETDFSPWQSASYLEGRSASPYETAGRAASYRDPDPALNDPYHQTPEEQLLIKERLQVIHQALAKLPPAQRQALLSIFIRHLTIAEAAKEQQLSPRTLKRLKRQALEQLEQELFLKI